jgi:hypothetical protein
VLLASAGRGWSACSGWWWRIIGNDVSDVVPLPPSVGGPGAPIWLGTGATHCLVVGGCRPTYVLDQGTDNTLINVTTVTASASALSMRPKVGSNRGLMARLH